MRAPSLPSPVAAAALLALLALAGCFDPGQDHVSPAPSSIPAPMRLASPAFADGSSFPRQETCDGASLSPPLDAMGVPAAAASLALIMQDPDVPLPQAPTRTLTHWTAWNVPVDAGAAHLDEGKVPAGTRQGANDNGGTGYLGPCPPAGSPPHHYNITAYALDAALALPEGSSRAQLESAMSGHIVTSARLIGLYSRQIP